MVTQNDLTGSRVDCNLAATSGTNPWDHFQIWKKLNISRIEYLPRYFSG
jgi:hypothetical protein